MCLWARFGTRLDLPCAAAHIHAGPAERNVDRSDILCGRRRPWSAENLDAGHRQASTQVTTTNRPTDPNDLAEVFANIARMLVVEGDVAHTLTRIVEQAVVTIEGCDHAAISMVTGRKVRTEAASDDTPRRVDALQYQSGQGPCLDAIRHHEVYKVDDLQADDRWPNFARRAAETTGIRSMLAFRLFIEEDTMGALNLYARRVGAFADRDEAEHIGSVFAAHAAVAWSTARHDRDMEEALRTRDLIGQAKGILMATRHLTPEEAFDALRQTSQRLNVKVRNVAEEVTFTGTLPDAPPVV